MTERFRRRSRPGVLLSLSMLLTMSALSMSAAQSHAKQVSGSATINEGDYYGWQMDVVIPSQIEVEISVQGDWRVDVLVVDGENYSMYADKLPFTFYEQYSQLGVSNASLNFTVISGTVYVIVDNSDRPAASAAASPTGQAIVEYWLGSSFDFHAVPVQKNVWLMYLFVSVAAFTLVLVVALARLAMKDRHRTNMKGK